VRPQRGGRPRRSQTASVPRVAPPAAPAAAARDSGARLAVGAVAGLTLLAAALHLFGQSQRPLWLDEACTYWTVHRAGALDLIRGVGTDGTPPLHFLIVSAVTAAFGFDEIVLRLPSLIAGICLVPAVFVVARGFGGWRTGVIAAALTAMSPLVDYYSVEARSYAILQLETVAAIHAASRAFDAPGEARWWALLSAILALQLWTNSYAVFLLPVPVLVAILTAAPSARTAIAARAAGASALAFLLWIPWLVQAVTTLGAGVADWIRPFWIATPPWAAIPRSLEVFGFGGAYPPYLGYLAQAPAARGLSLALGLGLLLVAAIAPRARSPRSGGGRGTLLLFAFLFVPLVGAWIYSVAAEPLYLVGRYDTMVLPAFLILLAIGLDRIFDWRAWLGAGIAAALTGLAALSLSTAMGPPEVTDTLDIMAGQVLGRDAAPRDLVVSTGSRQAVTAYYAERGGYRGAFTAFPAEMAEHPGWFSADRLLQDRTGLEREGEERARQLVEAARKGARIWILDSTNAGINQYLFLPLLREMEVDTTRTYRDLALICLKLQ
jgi:4-amino-4-deoxy-L-arabinose transferase-like glycosyltransferase